MKVAVTYNSRAGRVYCRRGTPAHERLPARRVGEVVNALRRLGHEAMAIEADLGLVERLTQFFGRPRARRWPGLVLNLAYGQQGSLRYVQTPAILELLGLPYVGSDPLGHALASDKLTAKRLFRAADLPTPAAAPAGVPAVAHEGVQLPAVVKPTADAASAGVHLARGERELHQIVEHGRQEMAQPVIVEAFVAGREINVSLLGNDPVVALPPVEVLVDGEVYDATSKHQASARLVCPAPLEPAVMERARRLAVDAFQVLRCRDWGRVDLRLDPHGELTLLEVNTIPAIGTSSSYRTAAAAAGIQGLEELMGRVIDVARARYRQS